VGNQEVVVEQRVCRLPYALGRPDDGCPEALLGQAPVIGCAPPGHVAGIPDRISQDERIAAPGAGIRRVDWYGDIEVASNPAKPPLLCPSSQTSGRVISIELQFFSCIGDRDEAATPAREPGKIGARSPGDAGGHATTVLQMFTPRANKRCADVSPASPSPAGCGREE